MGYTIQYSNVVTISFTNNIEEI